MSVLNVTVFVNDIKQAGFYLLDHIWIKLSFLSRVNIQYIFIENQIVEHFSSYSAGISWLLHILFVTIKPSCEAVA